jgi:hypothetical protein
MHSKLRGMPVEVARKLGGIEFAAGQGHGLENPLVPECRFLIRLFRRAAALLCVLRARIPLLFSHKNELPRRVELVSARLRTTSRSRTTSLPKPTTKGGYRRLTLLVRAGISPEELVVSGFVRVLEPPHRLTS